MTKIVDKEKQLTSFDEALFLNEKWVNFLATNIRNNLQELEDNALTIWIVGSWWSGKSSFLNILFDEFANKESEKITYYLEADNKESEVELLEDIKWFFNKFKQQNLSQQDWKDKMDEKFVKVETNEDGFSDWLKNITKLRKIEITGKNDEGKEYTETYYVIWINSWLFSNLKANPMISLLNYISLKLNLNISNLLEELIGFGLLVKKGIDGEIQWLPKLSVWVASITKLKDRFEKLLEEYLWEDSKVLLVIDDLDRIEPQEAVTLLDGIKLFLDNKYMWIFLLNDKDIVKRWLKQKLWLETDEEIENIATSYLDKLINLEINIEKYYNKEIFINHIKKFIYFHPFIRTIEKEPESILEKAKKLEQEKEENEKEVKEKTITYKEEDFDKKWTFLYFIDKGTININWEEISVYEALYRLKNMRVIKKLFKNFEIQWPALLYSYYPNLLGNQKKEKYFEIFKQMLEDYLQK